MKKGEECKIIQDLLPSYIEKITNIETNKYIENHLKECEHCSNILRDMGEEVVLDKIDEIQKIDYLKKIKKRNRAIISIILLITILVLIILISFFTSLGGVAIDENGNPEYFEAFQQWIIKKNTIKTSKITNLLIKSNMDQLEITMIFTFDQRNICIGARYCLDGYTKEEAQKKYEDLKEIETQAMPTITNVKIDNNKIIYNYNYWNNKNLEEIMNELSNYDNLIIQKM